MRKITGTLAASATPLLFAPAVWAGPRSDEYHHGAHMMWRGEWMHAWGPMSALFWGILLIAGIGLAYWLGKRSGSSRRRSDPDPLSLLKERFARGEIETEEFEMRKKALQR